MPQEWTAEVVAQMHLAKITKKRLAEESGYTPEYVSMVLNGHRDTESAKATILAALDRLVSAANAGKKPPQAAERRIETRRRKYQKRPAKC